MALMHYVCHTHYVGAKMGVQIWGEQGLGDEPTADLPRNGRLS